MKGEKTDWRSWVEGKEKNKKTPTKFSSNTQQKKTFLCPNCCVCEERLKNFQIARQKKNRFRCVLWIKKKIISLCRLTKTLRRTQTHTQRNETTRKKALGKIEEKEKNRLSVHAFCSAFFSGSVLVGGIFLQYFSFFSFHFIPFHRGSFLFIPSHCVYFVHTLLCICLTFLQKNKVLLIENILSFCFVVLPIFSFH